MLVKKFHFVREDKSLIPLKEVCCQHSNPIIEPSIPSTWAAANWAQALVQASLTLISLQDSTSRTVPTSIAFHASTNDRLIFTS
jgi:hypothetical protein